MKYQTTVIMAPARSRNIKLVSQPLFYFTWEYAKHICIKQWDEPEICNGHLPCPWEQCWSKGRVGLDAGGAGSMKQNI